MDNKRSYDEKDVVYVIGHINPDTDSICSAIAYANLKKKMTGQPYKARRAGQINSETKFVLQKFGVKTPAYMSDLRTQVKDINIRKVAGVSSDISIKKAWAMMGENNAVTLPIVHGENNLEGLITIGDIAKSYMDIYDSEILSKANTSFKNIVETLNGEMITGDENGYLTEGKVLIAAANPDLMESYIDVNDIVILGNRYESQLCAIEMNARCIIVCDGAEVSRTIKKLAQENNCVVIRTPYDTFTVARLINQSMPIRYFMKKDNLIKFTTEDFIDEIREIMASKSHRDFPVLDQEGKFCGMISRRNLLAARKKKIILVDHNERSQAVDGLEETEILEIIDHHRIGSIETINPVFFRNQPLGCTATIIYQMYQENNIEIDKQTAGLLCSAIISDTLIFRSPTCTPLDVAAANTLAKIAEIESEEYAKEMFAAGSNLLGKSPEEIFFQDFKKFTAGDNTFGVGQINSMSSDELHKLKTKLNQYLEKAYSELGLDMIFFMLTDIMKASSEIICVGDGARELINNAFKIDESEEDIVLEGFVSRKKQFIPPIMTALQYENV